jgi:hypothetical protein
MMRFARKLLPVLFVAMTGCALFPKWHWEKRGATDEDYSVDEKFCKLQSYSGTDGMVTNDSVRRMQRCLESRGWRKVEN